MTTTRRARPFAWDTDVFFPLTRCTTAGRLPTAAAAALMPLTLPIDVVLLPASALVGLFELF